MAQPLDVFKPGAAAQHFVGQVEHMIGLVVGQVHLQQAQPLVELFDSANLLTSRCTAATPPKQLASTFAPTW